MNRMFRPPPRALGRRGVHLLGTAAVWFGVALIASFSPDHPAGAGDFLSYVPGPLYAWLWAAAGFLAVVSAFQSEPGADTAGFVVVVGFATIRGLAYGWAWLDSLLPGVGGRGDPGGWFGLLCWCTVALNTMNVAGWREDGRLGEGS